MSRTQDVLRHYSIETTQKGADFIALFGTISMIVGTRIGAYNLRIRVEHEQQSQGGFRPTVVPMTQQANSRPAQSQASPRVESNFDDHGTGF